jgi:hypothetical protein
MSSQPVDKSRKGPPADAERPQETRQEAALRAARKGIEMGGQAAEAHRTARGHMPRVERAIAVTHRAAVAFWVLLLLGASAGALAYLSQHGVKKLEDLKGFKESMWAVCALSLAGSAGSAMGWYALKSVVPKDLQEAFIEKMKAEIQEDYLTVERLSTDLAEGNPRFDVRQVQGINPKIDALRAAHQKDLRDVPEGTYQTLMQTLQRISRRLTNAWDRIASLMERRPEEQALYDALLLEFRGSLAI